MHEIEKTIGDLISGREVLIFSPLDTVSSAIKAMRATGSGGVLVFENNALQGIFTERDLLYRVASEGREVGSTLLADVMTRNPETLQATACVSYAINRMALRGFSNIPITDSDGRVIEMLGVRDIVSHLREVFTELQGPDDSEHPADWRDIGGG